MDDLSKALDSLREMINTPGGQESISSLLKNFSGGDGGAGGGEAQNLPSNSGGAGDYGGNLLSMLQSGSRSPRLQLMNALRPYLSTRRQQKFDIIMNLMRYSDLPFSLLGKGTKR